MRVLTARWVFPVAGPPILDGAAAIAAGEIAAVGRREEIESAWPEAARWDLGQAALLPGLVNCHAHLEMATLGGARVLGLAVRVGSLEPGKRADLIAVSAGAVTASEPVDSLLRATCAADVLCSLVDGELCYARSEVPQCV